MVYIGFLPQSMFGLLFILRRKLHCQTMTRCFSNKPPEPTAPLSPGGELITDFAIFVLVEILQNG